MSCNKGFIQKLEVAQLVKKVRDWRDDNHTFFKIKK
jgi:hypothetical protein